jgi:hypothetical protein
MAGAAGKFTTMLRACVEFCEPAALESFTFTVKFEVVFGPIGVPVIIPVPLLSDNPAGNPPALTE